MKKRVAHTVDIIKRLFEKAEQGEPTAMELIGLHDELSRLERKWRMQFAEGSERRQADDIDKLNLWFDRLTRLIERSLRLKPDSPDAPPLRNVIAACESRQRKW